MSIILKRKFTPGDGWQYVGEEEAGGGGGGSLPDWWTVDSTPGGENVEFAGKVTVLANVDNSENIADLGDADGDTELTLKKGNGLKLWVGGEEVFEVDSNGAVTISPSDEGGLTVREGGDPTDGNHVLELLDRDDAGPGSHFDTYGMFTGQAVQLTGSDDSDFAVGQMIRARATTNPRILLFEDVDFNEVLLISGVGVATFSPGGTETLKVGQDQLGFFGHAVAAQPEIPATPTAQDIADVLVTLGLATQAA